MILNKFHKIIFIKKINKNSCHKKHAVITPKVNEIAIKINYYYYYYYYF